MGEPIRQLIAITLLVLSANLQSADGYGAYSDNEFPITPKVLSVGNEPERDIEKRIGVQPIFIMGSDRQSLAWAKSNSEYLKSRNAVGFLIEAKSDYHVEQIREHIALKAIFLLTDDRDLATQFSISHYPVFIDFAEGRMLQ